jgi:hypothetical protein
MNRFEPSMALKKLADRREEPIDRFCANPDRSGQRRGGGV